MIPFHTLGPREVVYTWENPDPPGGIRMWCTDRMEKWCRETNRQVFTAEVKEEQAQWYYENRGIETHRAEALAKNPERCLNPCLMLRLNRGNILNPEGPSVWDLMLDGHHRYVTLAIMKIPVHRLWHLTEEEARQFEVCGVPQPQGPLNVNTFSGLGLDL